MTLNGFYVKIIYKDACKTIDILYNENAFEIRRYLMYAVHQEGGDEGNKAIIRHLKRHDAKGIINEFL